MEFNINKILNLKDSLYWRIIKWIYTFNVYSICSMKGIKIGDKCTFYGKTILKKLNNSSKITIGSYCTFRSMKSSNLIGLNRPCIISTLSDNSSLEIGNYCGFSGTVIGCFKEIKLGQRVRCGANTLITDSDWHLDDPRSGEPKAIIIEDNVWLGVNVIVLKGVRIGANSVIGAGSVVVNDIPENVIAAGNPCRVIKQLTIKNQH